ncbi:smalltalk protein [Bacteroides salyersiae]|nr:smalltalk protein [Bacteroides salyersiae]
MKKTIWDTILKVVIVVASALAGVFGGQALMA